MLSHFFFTNKYPFFLKLFLMIFVLLDSSIVLAVKVIIEKNNSGYIIDSSTSNTNGNSNSNSVVTTSSVVDAILANFSTVLATSSSMSLTARELRNGQNQLKCTTNEKGILRRSTTGSFFYVCDGVGWQYLSYVGCIYNNSACPTGYYKTPMGCDHCSPCSAKICQPPATQDPVHCDCIGYVPPELAIVIPTPTTADHAFKLNEWVNPTWNQASFPSGSTIRLTRLSSDPGLVPYISGTGAQFKFDPAGLAANEWRAAYIIQFTVTIPTKGDFFWNFYTELYFKNTP